MLASMKFENGSLTLELYCGWKYQA